MKKSISLLLVGLACIFAFILFSGVECNENEPSTCQVFQSEKITWRPTPIDDLDLPLNPADHFQGLTGNNKYCTYWFANDDIENLCLGEAVVLTITFEIKEENKNYIYGVAGFVSLNQGEKYISVEDFTYNTSGGVYYATGKLTIPGDPDKELGAFRCNATIHMYTQSDVQTTHNVQNNTVKSITLDYGYTKWF